MEKLVADENATRDELYDEVMISNHTGKNHLIDIKKSFSRSFQAESPWLVLGFRMMKELGLRSSERIAGRTHLIQSTYSADIERR